MLQLTRNLIAPLVVSIAIPAAADVTLPPLIGDGMVLQQQTEVTIWGWASPGEAIHVTSSWGEAAQTVTGARGRWEVPLSTPAAGGPYEMTIQGTTPTVIRDVLVGEVWVCSGQSNMEWPLSQSQDARAQIEQASFDTIRLFQVPNTLSAHRRNDSGGQWTRCMPETVESFSAVGYYFARDLLQELDVPVGIINADWGGTKAEAWMSEEALRAFPTFSGDLEFLSMVRNPLTRIDALHRRQTGWWDALDSAAGMDGSWTQRAFDDSSWQTMRLPATLSGELAGFDGVVHFRRTIEIPDGLSEGEATLHLGPIDDYDDAWVNGHHVGNTHQPNRWNQPREYTLPADCLRSGTNTLAVRMLDTGGLGGINGSPQQMKLVLSGQGGEQVIPLAGTWHYQVGVRASVLPPIPQDAGVGPNMPSVLFNAMINPLVKYRTRGFLWYQGESNRGAAEQYASLFPALINNWRSEWGLGDLPFYFIQIAPFRYARDSGQTAALRESQAQALQLPNTGMVVTMDIGDPADIHPRNKEAVGRRLALWALEKTYDRDQAAHSGPLFNQAEPEGSTLRVRFDHAESGLVLRDSARSHFLIAGSDKVFRQATAVIDGDDLVLSNPNVQQPVAVRYAWEAACEPNLFNAEGLPAAPFRSDRWQGQLPRPVNDAAMEKLRADDSGFVDLFNGNDLTGWINVNCAPSTWRVSDGMIVCSGVPTGVLRTDRHFENFILELEWRHLQPGGNAGLFLWSDPLTARGQPFTRSVEVQVMDGLESSWYTSDGDIFPIHGAVMTPHNGRGGSRAFPTKRNMNPSPLWNHYRVTCRDGTIRLAVNGEEVTAGDDVSPRKGYICLESEGTPIDFRNIRIKELPPSTTPLPEDAVANNAQGFRSLYNGVDFSGWKYGPEHEGHWTAQDWRIDFDGQGADLWSEESFGDFTLICDWRWKDKGVPTKRPVILSDGSVAQTETGEQKQVTVTDAGDSGIYLRGSSKSQVNIWCWPIGSGEVYGYRTDGSMPAEVRAGVTPRVVADAPIGTWNRFEITMIDDRLTVLLNGQLVLENAQLPGVAEEGPIALQMHGGALQFANIYVRELD